jgi:ribosomal protein S18 acetylase RimI-like enzyme
VSKITSQIIIRDFDSRDLPAIMKMFKIEGWSTLLKKEEEYMIALKQSSCVLVAVKGEDTVGFLRAITDGVITTYICELIVLDGLRGHGIGRKLLTHCHSQYPKTRMELLASSTSHTYYESLKFRPFYGFRRTFEEL